MQNIPWKSWETPIVLQTISRSLVTPEISALAEEAMRLLETSTEIQRVFEEARKQNQRKFTWDLESLEKSKLELFNFRVDSTSWTKKLDKTSWITYKESSTWDIWEYVDWVPEELKWEQFFTWDAAMRETTKVWKRMPTDEEWIKICKPYWNDWEWLSKKLWIPMAGYRYYLTKDFNNQGNFGFYWSFITIGDNWHGLKFNSNRIFPSSSNNPATGFSVRCFKN